MPDYHDVQRSLASPHEDILEREIPFFAVNLEACPSGHTGKHVRRFPADRRRRQREACVRRDGPDAGRPRMVQECGDRPVVSGRVDDLARRQGPQGRQHDAPPVAFPAKLVFHGRASSRRGHSTLYLPTGGRSHSGSRWNRAPPAPWSQILHLHSPSHRQAQHARERDRFVGTPQLVQNPFEVGSRLVSGRDREPRDGADLPEEMLALHRHALPGSCEWPAHCPIPRSTPLDPLGPASPWPPYAPGAGRTSPPARSFVKGIAPAPPRRPRETLHSSIANSMME